MLRKIVEEGIAQGTINPSIDPEAVASHIIGSLEGGMVLSRIERNDAALRNARNHLEIYLETQVRKVPTSEKARSPQLPPRRNRK